MGNVYESGVESIDEMFKGHVVLASVLGTESLRRLTRVAANNFFGGNRGALRTAAAVNVPAIGVLGLATVRLDRVEIDIVERDVLGAVDEVMPEGAGKHG